jgi:two-component system, OmpR family, sensor histidine kinase BaeS
MNRLITRLVLAMLLVAVVSLAIVPIAQYVAARQTIANLSVDFRERLEQHEGPRGRPPGPRGEGPPPKTVATDEDQDFLSEENTRLFDLFRDYRIAQQRAVYLGIAGAVLLAVVLAVWLSRGIAKPIEAVSTASSKLAQGNLQTRVELQGLQTDETQRLAKDFNSMAESLERYEGERKAMIADIAHELRNPLATMQMRVDALSDGLVTFNEDEAKLLQGQVGLLARLIDDLRVLSLADAGRLSLNLMEVELNELTANVVRNMETRAKAVNVGLEFSSSSENIFVNADPDRLAQVLNNLLDNALRVTPENGTIRVRLEASSSEAKLTVRDTGPGILEEDLPTIFERFVQGKRRDTQGKSTQGKSTHSKTGSGLGLAIVKTIVNLHHGQVGASNYSDGAQVEVTLPINKIWH